MKKLIILALFFYPALLFAQQQVVLKSGIQFEAYIRGVQGNNLCFYQKIKEIDSKKVSIMLIRSISGEIYKSTTTKALIKKNPKIIFNSTYTPIKQDSSYQGNEVNRAIVLTSGDLIMRSSVLRLSGFAVAGATTIAYYACAFKKMEPKDQNTLFIVSGSVSLVLYIAGEITLFNAGKMHNREAVTLSPASQGIGLAINF
jgi:hypothetical protein